MNPDLHQTRIARALTSWLPEFCAVPVLLTHLLIGAIVGMVVGLSPAGSPLSLQSLSLAVLLASWASLCAGIALCPLRKWVARLPSAAAVLASYGVVVATVAAVMLVAAWINGVLRIAGDADSSPLAFAGRCALLAALVWTTLLRYYYVRAQWQRGVAAQATAQLDALQARIRPHFLFNSMNTIATLIRRSPDAAERAVEDLSDLFRVALGESRTLSTLGAEFDLAQRYLHIEQLRLADRLQVTSQLPDSLRDFPMPYLLLQPLVENAVGHGIESMPAGGRIDVSARAEGDRVLIDVSNPYDPAAPRRRRGTGIALDNIRRRLELLYAGAAQMEVRQESRSYQVRVILPARTAIAQAEPVKAIRESADRPEEEPSP